ncbi:MAG: hypothetical protein QXS68_08095 [Candidatus Methanomethylicaceae archaeon]
MEAIKDWLIPVSVFISLIGVTIKFWQASNEYKLKLAAEKRSAESSEAEKDINLLKIFTEIMNIAHGRSGYLLSEKAVDALFQKGMVKENDLMNLSDINSKIVNSSLITLPVGAAAQHSAFAAIAVLGKRHAVLKDVAIQGLESLVHVNEDLAKKYLNVLRSE